MRIYSSRATREPCTRKLRAIGGGQAGALAHARVRVVAGRTEGAADVFARFLELMAARGRGDGKIASLAPGGADGRSAGPQAGEPRACVARPFPKRNTHAPASVGGRFRQRQTPLRWTLAPLPHTPHRPHRGLRLEGLIPGHILSLSITWTDSVKPHQGTHLGRQGSRCSSTTRCVCPWARAINLAPRDLSACRSRDGFGMGHPSLRWMARCECLKFLLLHVAAPSMSNGPHHHA